MPELNFYVALDGASDYAAERLGGKAAIARLQEVVTVTVTYVLYGIRIVDSSMNPQDAFSGQDLFVRRAAFLIVDYLLLESRKAMADADVRQRIADLMAGVVPTFFEPDVIDMLTT